MKNILFVCTGNSCRSVMAEGLFKKFTLDRPDVTGSSAGISAIDGYPATEETIRVLREENVDVSDHGSRRLTPEMVQDAYKIFVMEKIHRDWVLALDPSAKSKVHLLTEYASPKEANMIGSGIPDPIRMSGQFYQNVFNIIRDCVENIAKEL